MTTRSNSFGTGACTYDGDNDDDSFETAACTMYSGFSFRHAITAKEKVGTERFDRTIKNLCSEDWLSLDDYFFVENKHLIYDISDTDDENLSYVSEIETEEKSNRTFLFTAKNTLRLDIMSASSQSLTTLDTKNTSSQSLTSLDTMNTLMSECTATMDINKIPDLFSCSTGSQIAMNSSTLCHTTSFPALFGSITLPTVRATKFKSIPVRSSVYDT